jgi:hypothetical protein
MKSKNINLGYKFLLINGLFMLLYIALMYLSYILSPYIHKNGIYVALYWIVTWAMLFVIIIRIALKVHILKRWEQVLLVVCVILVCLFDNNLRNRIDWNSGILRSINSMGSDEISVIVNNKMDKLYGNLEGWIIAQAMMLFIIIVIHFMLYRANKKMQSDSKEIGMPSSSESPSL